MHLQYKALDYRRRLLWGGDLALVLKRPPDFGDIFLLLVALSKQISKALTGHKIEERYFFCERRPEYGAICHYLFTDAHVVAFLGP